MTAPFAVKDRGLDGDSHVIELIGQVDLYTAPEFKERIVEVIEEGKKHILVDLSNVTFFDSTALGVLVGALKRLRPAGGSVAIVSADERIRKLFEITGLDGTFTFQDTPE